jgi:sulfite exporter TauE/SafE
MSPLKALMARMSYHVGRLSAYMSLGYVFGYFGWGVRWAGMQQWLSIAIGLMMLTLVFFSIIWVYQQCRACGEIEKNGLKSNSAEIVGRFWNVRVAKWLSALWNIVYCFGWCCGNIYAISR